MHAQHNVHMYMHVSSSDLAAWPWFQLQGRTIHSVPLLMREKEHDYLIPIHVCAVIKKSYLGLSHQYHCLELYHLYSHSWPDLQYIVDICQIPLSTYKSSSQCSALTLEDTRLFTWDTWGNGGYEVYTCAEHTLNSQTPQFIMIPLQRSHYLAS